jgi:VWFA-related protein
MRTPKLMTLLLSLFCLGAPIRMAIAGPQAPQGASTQSPQNALTFRSTTELVTIPAVVRGKSGHVPGLNKTDFVVLEDGKPRDIAVFEEVRGNPETVQRASVPEGEFTNVLLGTGTPKRLTVIAIDMINTAVIDQAFVRDALQKFVPRASLAGEPTALVALEPRSLRMIYDFTTDPKKLAAAVASLKAEHPRTGERSVALDNSRPPAESLTEVGSSDAQAARAARDLEAWLDGKQADEGMLQLQRRITRYATVDAINQLASWLAAVPGRKSLIWVTGGLPFTEAQRVSAPRSASGRSLGITSSPSVEALDQQAELWEHLNAANVAVYPVDARRMVNTAYDVISPEHKNSPLYVDKQITQFEEKDRVTTFEAIAQATGGKPCYNTPDLTKCFFEASQDAGDYYQIGYYVDRSTQPGWHKLEVKCKQDGAHVRTRRGFLYHASADDAARKADIQLAIYSPLQSSALPFRGRWTGQMPSSSGKRKVGLEMRIPPDSVSIDEQLSQFSLEIAAVAFDRKGQVAASFAQSLHNRLNAGAISEIRSNGINYSNVLEVLPGEYVVRFAVRDNVTRRTGSVLTGLQVK